MASDALAPYVTRTSTTIVLNMQDKWVPVFHKEGFQQPAPSVLRNLNLNLNLKMIDNANVCLFPKINLVP